MTGNRISDYEQWPDGGVRPTLPILRILADTYGTTWDELIDVRDLLNMPVTGLSILKEGVRRDPLRPRPFSPRWRRSTDRAVGSAVTT
jgi:hypothetical protein